jgi:hypothetical protein
MKKNYFVKVTLTQESVFDVEIMADDDEQAETIAQEKVWEDAYDDNIKWSLEITDENYEASYIECDDCCAVYDVYEDECPECLEKMVNAEEGSV